MKRAFSLMPCMLLVVALITACQQQPQTQRNSDTRTADETTLKNLDVEWSRAATATKDLDKTVSYYAADAVVLPPNGPIATTGDAIRQIWKEYLTSPDFAGSWKAAKVEVARSGEIGYIRGTWEFTWKDANGKPASDRGKFVEVWKKQTDNSWKCAVDAWNSDLPLPAPAQGK